MIKKKVGSQIENLTLDHKSPWSMGQMISNWGVKYTIGKMFLKAIKYCLQMLKKDLI
jgi:hypothetical protein